MCKALGSICSTGEKKKSELEMFQKSNFSLESQDGEPIEDRFLENTLMAKEKQSSLQPSVATNSL